MRMMIITTVVEHFQYIYNNYHYDDMGKVRQFEAAKLKGNLQEEPS